VIRALSRLSWPLVILADLVVLTFWCGLFHPLVHACGRLACWIGWHRPDWYSAATDGFTTHLRCARCGYVGMLDAQGNLL